MDIRHYDEIAKCGNSFEYFCEKYVKIVHPRKGLISFKLYDFQKRYITHLLGNRFVIGTKFRQGGFSTLTIAFFLWKFLFKTDENFMTFSKYDREAISLGTIFKKMIDHLPDWLKPKLSKNNDHTKVNEENGCVINFHTPEAACGKRIDHLFIDEAAFIRDMDRHWKAVWPTLSTGGRCVVMSSINSNSGWFHDTYMDAKDGKNNFVLYRAEYTEHPDYANVEWTEELQKNLGDKGWRQEILQEFVQTGELKLCNHPTEEKTLLEEAGSDTSHVPEWKHDDAMAPFRERLRVENVSVEKRVLPERPIKGMAVANNTKPTGLIERPTPTVDPIGDMKLREGDWKSFNITDVVKLLPIEERTKGRVGGHPEIADDFDMSSKNLSELFEGLAQEHDSYKDAARFWRQAYEGSEKRQEELESKVKGAYPAELLQLAGVIDKKEANEIEQTSSAAKIDILKKVLEGEEFSPKMKLDFGDYLEVNGIPTLVTTNSVKNTYMGLSALLESHDRSVELVSKILKAKLRVLFGFGKE